MRENSSYAPLGLGHFPFTHGLRRGRYYHAAPRLESPALDHRRSEIRVVTPALADLNMAYGALKRRSSTAAQQSVGKVKTQTEAHHQERHLSQGEPLRHPKS